MGFDNETVVDVYHKTGDYCNYCGKKLSLKNYGKVGNHGAWEIDHSIKSKECTDYVIAKLQV